VPDSRLRLRDSVMRAQPKLIATLLLFALSLVALLAYQAQAAARSHRAAVERTLHDYASFATWQLTQEATRELLAGLIATFVIPHVRVDPDDRSAWLPVDQWVTALGERPVRAPYLDGVRFYFRLDWRDTSVTTAGETPSPEVLRWMKNTVLAYPERVPESADMRPRVWGSADMRSPRRLNVIFSNDNYVATFARVDGRLRVLGYGISRDLRGRPLVAYGFEEDAERFVGPVLRQILERSPLLPPSLVRGAPAGSILSVRASDLAGNVVFRSDEEFDPQYAAADTLDVRFGNLVLALSLHPEIAPGLVVGGLPRSRLPMLLGLLTLTAALVAVALLQLRRQQDLARLRTNFVSGVSHELRTPLAQIRLFAELMRKGQLRSEAERTRSAEIIDEEAQRLTILIDNVLSFASAEHGAARISPQLVDLSDEARGAVAAFVPLARERRASLRVDGGEGAWVSADPGALRQVLLNLLDNAVKYSPPGRTVTVTVSATDGRARVTVDDEGPGVPVAARSRVWEPYVRLERGADAPTGGTGIGLSIVRELIELHGGRAWIEGAPTGGARFAFELPRVDVAGARRAEGAPPAAYVGNGQA
jgi:signal transduction histidine kinase